MAEAVAVATELVLEARGKNVALASLARSGTPVGVLMRRWALFAHGLELPHYTLSIVRGRGIDLNALRYLAAHHRPPEVMFVDGWTGKGAIARELAAAIDGANRTLELPPGQRFSDEIAVLADTGHCVTIFATRDDRLIPSACLNSTVSGLVSRTVLNDRYITEADFHGAKYYKALASVDVSEAYLAAICARFASAADRLPALMAAARDRDTAVTWSGWAAVEALRDEYGIADINLIKPGVGETTRVLLRRVPWKVLIRPEAEGLTHVLRLADERGCGVEEVADLPFSCVGIIRPHLAVT
jgi:hypothetical protein